MNEPTIEQPIASSAAECCAEMDQCVRRNPAAAILIAMGAGLAIAVLVRALRPEPTPRQRLTHMIDDIEQRLRDAASPLLRKASGLAGDGAEALRDRAHDGEAWAERLLRDATRRVRRLVG